MEMFFAAVEGDPLDSGDGSRVIEGTPLITIQGDDGRSRSMAFLGHRAWCDACKSAGVIIASPGSPHQHRMIDFTSSGQLQALGGDFVLCKCERHPRIVPVYGRSWMVEGDGNLATSTPKCANPHQGLKEESRQKLADHAPLHSFMDHSTRICPNMTNEEFADRMLECRNKAASLVAKRVAELKRWAAGDQQRVKDWFGNGDEALRTYLLGGLACVLSVLNELTPDNFVRYSQEAMKLVGCYSDPQRKTGVVAEVCSPDTRTHTIAIHLDFCELRDFSYSTDSQTSTLIHELTHFEDTFSARDWQYSMRECLRFARTHPHLAPQNADTITGYVVYER